MAIKIVIVILALVVLIWLLYVLNVKLPSLPKINVERYEKPPPRVDQKSEAKPFITREAKVTSDSDLFKKVSQAAGAVFSDSSSGEKSSE